MTYSEFTGLALAFAGMCLLWRELLLSRTTATFPCAPLIVRIVMWGAGLGTVFVGALFLWHDHDLSRHGHVIAFAGEASLPIAFLSAGVLLYQSVLLLNLFTERRPQKVWDAIARIERRTGTERRGRFFAVR